MKTKLILGLAVGLIAFTMIMMPKPDVPNTGLQTAPPPPHGLPPKSAKRFNCDDVLLKALAAELDKAQDPSNIFARCQAIVADDSTRVVVQILEADGITVRNDSWWPASTTDWEAAVRGGVPGLYKKLKAGPPPPSPTPGSII